MTFYVTFGIGTICGKNYCAVHAEDELTARLALNTAMHEGLLPKWAGIYTVPPDKSLEMERLRNDFEVVGSAHRDAPLHYGPCPAKGSAECASCGGRGVVLSLMPQIEPSRPCEVCW